MTAEYVLELGNVFHSGQVFIIIIIIIIVIIIVKRSTIRLHRNDFELNPNLRLSLVRVCKSSLEV